MTAKEARHLGKTIVKTSDCIVKFGTTNGRRCLHLRSPSRSSSVTIYDRTEWTYHDWNHYASKAKSD